jgi:hypothetical protein
VVYVSGSGEPGYPDQAVGGSQLIPLPLARSAIVGAVADLLGRRAGGGR